MLRANQNPCMPYLPVLLDVSRLWAVVKRHSSRIEPTNLLSLSSPFVYSHETLAFVCTSFFSATN